MTLTLENRIESIEVPYGFRMTELGILPEDWQVVPFALIATLRKTKIDPRTNQEKKMFCVELEHISQSTGVLEGNTFTSSKSSIKTQFLQGDVLFGKLRAYLRKYWLANRNGVASTEIWPIIPNLSRSLSEYIFFIVQTDRFIEAASLAYGTHMPRSDWNAIATLKISLPPLLQQRAIAAALSDIDSLINNLNHLIAKKRNIKLAAMQQLLTGKQRLPGFNGEWEKKQLGDIAFINMGQSPDSKNYNFNGNGLPLIQGNADIKNRKSIHRVWTTHITKICDKDDLILTVRAPVGSIALAIDASCLGRGVCSLKSMNVSKDFLFHAMVFAEESWKILEQGSTFTSANSAQIAEFPIMIPNNKKEQTAIANVLSDMDTELSALELQLDKARNLKQGMMQELLTGRIRLT